MTASKANKELGGKRVDTRKDKAQGVTAEEWAALPITLDAATAAKVLRVDTRHMQRHGTAYGGRKIARKWLFPKDKIAEIAGIAS